MVEITPPYRHVVQLKNFCAPACIQMILSRRDEYVDQEALAHELGVKIDTADANLYGRYFPAAEQKEDIGLRFADFEKKDVKKVLAKHRLQYVIHPVSQLSDPKKQVAQWLQQGSDILVNFWWTPINGIDFGHFVLASAFDPTTNVLTLCDPLSVEKSRWDCDLQKIIAGMSTEWTGSERGFVVFDNIGDPAGS